MAPNAFTSIEFVTHFDLLFAVRLEGLMKFAPGTPVHESGQIITESCLELGFVIWEGNGFTTNHFFLIIRLEII